MVIPNWITAQCGCIDFLTYEFVNSFWERAICMVLFFMLACLGTRVCMNDCYKCFTCSSVLTLLLEIQKLTSNLFIRVQKQSLFLKLSAATYSTYKATIGKKPRTLQDVLFCYGINWVQTLCPCSFLEALHKHIHIHILHIYDFYHQELDYSLLNSW